MGLYFDGMVGEIRRPASNRAAALAPAAPDPKQPTLSGPMPLPAPELLRRRRIAQPNVQPDVLAPFPPFAWDFNQVGDFAHRSWRPDVRSIVLIEVLAPMPSEAAWHFETTELIRRPRRVAAVDIEPTFVPMPARIPWGYDLQEPLMLRRPRRLIPTDQGTPTAIPRINWGWERMPDPIRRTKRTPGEYRDDLDVITGPRPAIWGWDFAMAISPPRRPRRLIANLELVTNFPPRWTSGWEVAPFQPPAFRRNRSGAFARWDDGMEAPEILQHFDGWEPTLFYPPHPKPERSAAIALGDIGGAWGPFIYLVPSAARARDRAVYSADAWDIGHMPRRPR